MITEEVPRRAKLIWNAVLAFRWAINAILVAAPLAFCILLTNIMMFVSYLVFNKVWGEGNVFWVTNWIFLVLQSISTLPLLFEISLILQWTHPWRLFSLTAAILYNLAYLGFLSDLFWLYFGTDK